ncbi:hypothetical protein GCM10009802_02690 [Streptomyces synnematoformans]|uniref:HTH cro/C1-type domain-containing protein n=2 Tax=Streptomyces synnematoformans TaxID=415721 RepID=A0ABP5IW37_9ACTN
MNGARLRALREDARITIKEFADKAGYTADYVSGIELGKHDTAGMPFARRAAEILGSELGQPVTVDDITDGVIPRRPYGSKKPAAPGTQEGAA